jgi:predicted DNA-binding protein
MGGRRSGIASKGQRSATLGTELDERVKQLAEKYGAHVSTVIRYAVERYMKAGDDAYRDDMGAPKDMKAGAARAIDSGAEDIAKAGT